MDYLLGYDNIIFASPVYWFSMNNQYCDKISFAAVFHLVLASPGEICPSS